MNENNYTEKAMALFKEGYNCTQAVVGTFADELEIDFDTAMKLASSFGGLIEQSVALVGKPVALMNKDDKVRAIQFLSRHGAFLVTKSGDKIAKHFGISKYTLYSYIDMKQEENKP